jgi:glycosyltransferase EpsJ
MSLSKMSQPVLSIVCPVYNCEAYLDELVQAIVDNANDTKLEWLFVHDRATDQSEERLRSALEIRSSEIRCNLVHLVHTENRGLAAARNTGIRAARGSYIGFIDSDDIPLPGFSEVILESLLKHAPEVLEVNFEEFVDATELLSRKAAYPDVLTIGRLDSGNHFRLLFTNNFFAWTRIVKRDLFTRVMFTENRLAYEDIPYSMALFCEAGSVHFLENALIGYRKRIGSITSIRDRRFLDQYTQLRHAIQIYRQHPAVTRHRSFEWRLLRKLLILLLKGTRINSQSARQQFFQSIYTDLSDPKNPIKHPANGAGWMLARMLALSSRIPHK